MRATVYVVATFHRWGDQLHAFGTRREAEACVMEYAREFWDQETLGRFPKSYRRLLDAWAEHDLWGAVESRWELERLEIDLPVQAGGRRGVPAAPLELTTRRKRARPSAAERSQIGAPPRIDSGPGLI